MRKILWSVGLLGLCGCITAYQPHGFTGGYSDARLGPGVFLVMVNGNALTGPATLTSYAQRRGQELCAQDGYAQVRLEDVQDDVDRRQDPSTYITTTQRTHHQTETITTEQPGAVTVRHTISVRAVCLGQPAREMSAATVGWLQPEPGYEVPALLAAP